MPEAAVNLLKRAATGNAQAFGEIVRARARAWCTRWRSRRLRPNSSRRSRRS